MKKGNRYLLKTGFSGNVLIEVICLEVTGKAYKVHNVIQNHDSWMKKSDFTAYGDYEIYQKLGSIPPLTPSER